MGAGNSSQGKVYQGRATDPSHKDARGFRSVQSSAPVDSKVKMPELTIKSTTWTRESHGLFDFEVKESERKLFEKKQFKIKGSHRIYRAESEVTTELAQSSKFELEEGAKSQEVKDQIIARLLFLNGTYWVFHKNFIDDGIEQVLEKKPEDKIWRVVRDTRCPEMDMPCYRLRKKDLIKVGRVRFKIRDIMSPEYRRIENGEDFKHEQHREIFPSLLNASVSSSIIDPNQESEQDIEEAEAGNADLNVNGEIADAHQNALLTESDPEDSEEPELQHANTILQGGAGDAMNAEDVQSFREDVNNTQFEPGKVVPKAKTGTLLRDDSEKTTNAAKKKNLDAVENASQQNGSELPVCRICLMEDNEIDNPLFAPCKCSGSMRFIHHLCLKTWFANKRIMKVSNIVTTYFWKNLECELCKTAYPYETRSLDGKEMLNIIEYDTPQPSYGQEAQYIVLESISSNTSKVIHVVNMRETSQLYIGRGHDAHVRVTDISVSRLHATLVKSQSGYYFLTDNDSKFGTLSLVKTPLELPQGSHTTLQIGRSIFDIEVKNMSNFTLNSCLCFGGKPKKQVGYEDNLISLNGCDYFPSNYASQEFLDQMDKRREVGKRRSFKSKKSSSTNAGNSSIRQNAVGQPAATAVILTENQEDESLLGQEDEPRARSGNHFNVGPHAGHGGQGRNQILGSNELDYGYEDEEDEESEEEDENEVIMAQPNSHQHHAVQQQQQRRQNRERDLEAEEEEQLARAIQESIAQQEAEDRNRRTSQAHKVQAQAQEADRRSAAQAHQSPEEEKVSDAQSLDAQIEQIDRELSETPLRERLDAVQTSQEVGRNEGSLKQGTNFAMGSVEESKKQDLTASLKVESINESQTSSNVQGSGQAPRVDTVSNISTQRASNIVNRFTNQTRNTNSEEIKEVIEQPLQSPIPGITDKLNASNDMIEVHQGLDFSTTQVGALDFMTQEPATQAIQKGKASDLRGKRTERENDSILTEAIQFGDANEMRTQRVAKEEEEVKNGRILEELESDHENESERRAASRQSAVAMLDGIDRSENVGLNVSNGASAQGEAEGNPIEDLPGQATEVQPPDMGGNALLNQDNMETIQQREEDGASAAGREGASEEVKNNTD